MPAETHSHRGPSTATRSSASCASSSPRSSRSIPTRSRPTARLRDDLDADDYALIELVEARRGRSSASGWSGSRSTTTTSRSWRTVRDAIECVARRPRAARRGRDRARWRSPTPAEQADPTGSTRSRRRSVCASTTVRCCCGSLAHRSWCAENGDRRIERAPRVPRRLRARSRRDALRVRALSRPSRRPALGGARRRRERARARRGRARDRPRRASAARQGRGRGRRPREAVDPRRRVRGGRRRRLPRLRASRSRAISCCAACRERIADAVAGPGGRDYKTRLQEATAAAVARAAPLRRARRGPRSRQALLRGGLRRRRLLRRGRRRIEEASRAGRRRGSRATRPAGRGGRAGGTAMPELPEVEVMRRDLEREVVGKKIKSVEVTGTRSVRRHKNKKEFIDVLERPQDRRRCSAAGKYLVMRLDGTDALDRAPRHVGPAAAREDRAREGAEAHARRDHVHAGRPAAVRRPAHVRRDVRDEVRRHRRAGRRARAPRARSARDRDLVGPVRADARRAQDAS